MNKKIISNRIKQMGSDIKSTISNLSVVYYREDIANKINESFKENDFWSVANILGDFLNSKDATSEEIDDCKNAIATIQSFMGLKIKDIALGLSIVKNDETIANEIKEAIEKNNFWSVINTLVKFLNSKEETSKEIDDCKNVITIIQNFMESKTKDIVLGLSIVKNDETIANEIKEAFSKNNFSSVANVLSNYIYSKEIPSKEIDGCKNAITTIRNFMESKVKTTVLNLNVMNYNDIKNNKSLDKNNLWSVANILTNYYNSIGITSKKYDNDYRYGIEKIKEFIELDVKTTVLNLVVLECNNDIKNAIKEAFEKNDFWSVANILGNYYNSTKVTSKEISDCNYAIKKIQDFMELNVKSTILNLSVVYHYEDVTNAIKEAFEKNSILPAANALVNHLNHFNNLERSSSKSSINSIETKYSRQINRCKHAITIIRKFMETDVKTTISNLNMMIDNKDIKNTVKEASQQNDFWFVANTLTNYYNSKEATTEEINYYKNTIKKIQDFMELEAKTTILNLNIMKYENIANKVNEAFEKNDLLSVANVLVNYYNSKEATTGEISNYNKTLKVIQNFMKSKVKTTVLSLNVIINNKGVANEIKDAFQKNNLLSVANLLNNYLSSKEATLEEINYYKNALQVIQEFIELDVKLTVLNLSVMKNKKGMASEIKDAFQKDNLWTVANLLGIFLSSRLAITKEIYDYINAIKKTQDFIGLSNIKNSILDLSVMKNNVEILIKFKEAFEQNDFWSATNILNKYLNSTKATPEEINDCNNAIKIIQNFIKKLDIKTTVLNLNVVINNEVIANKIKEAFKKDDYWSVANILGNYYNSKEVTPEEINDCQNAITIIRESMGEQARTSTAPTTIVFGTSGWRGVIGKDFTVLNVHKGTKAIIDMMKSKEFLNANKYFDFSDVQEKGIVVFRDNRFMGDEFMVAVMQELAKEGIKIYFAGECPTGVGSAVVVKLDAAGSINITPSHNPMEYAGIKFNPADGGPADKNLTDSIMKESIKYMQPDSNFVKATDNYTDLLTNVDAAQIYTEFLQEKLESGEGVFDLQKVKDFLKSKQDELFILVDNMHGSSRGYLQKILGEDLVAELVKSGAMQFVNTNDDYSFHGVKPEPSANNQQILIDIAKTKQIAEPNRKMTLAVALDPDADRIRFGTAQKDIPMNLFGSIAYAHLLSQGYTGSVATTLPSSKFSIAIAKANNQSYLEVPVGFKYFRPLKDALVKSEESDGISFRGHTLEKDGIAGFLMALQTMMVHNKDIGEYLKELQDKYGFYYAGQSPKEVKDISIENWEKLRTDVVTSLKNTYKNVETIQIDSKDKKVSEINTDDGIMIKFNDNSWLLIRSSGTEPKFRVSYEVVSEKELTSEEVAQHQQAYADAGLKLLDNALKSFGK